MDYYGEEIGLGERLLFWGLGISIFVAVFGFLILAIIIKEGLI